MLMTSRALTYIISIFLFQFSLVKLVSTFRDSQFPQKWRAAFAESEVVSSGNAIGTGSFGVVKDAISRTYGPVQ